MRVFKRFPIFLDVSSPFMRDRGFGLCKVRFSCDSDISLEKHDRILHHPAVKPIEQRPEFLLAFVVLFQRIRCLDEQIVVRAVLYFVERRGKLSQSDVTLVDLSDSGCHSIHLHEHDHISCEHDDGHQDNFDENLGREGKVLPPYFSFSLFFKLCHCSPACYL